MKNDLDKLQLNLEYGQIIKFNNNYNILNPSDKNFKKYDKFIKNSEIALPVFLLKFNGIEINTSQNFLKFKLNVKFQMSNLKVKCQMSNFKLRMSSIKCRISI